MNSPSKPAGKLTVRELVALSLMAAVIIGAQLAMSGLPNIHLTALLIILTAQFYGWRVMYTVGVYVLAEGLLYGFGLWWVAYLYAWPLLAAVAVLLRRNTSPVFWAVIAGAHGLAFGGLCALPYIFISGGKAAFAYWIAGIPFDLAHCGGNFVLTVVLFKPLRTVMEKITDPG